MTIQKFSPREKKDWKANGACEILIIWKHPVW